MGVFNNLLGDWVEIKDPVNSITIEDFSYESGIDEKSIEGHCVKCTAVNQCWFKNEKGKIPDEMKFSNMEILNMILKGIVPGLFHPHCHCKKNKIIQPNEKQIELVIPDGKDRWLFSDKKDWILSMGYGLNKEFLHILEKCIKKAYSQGNYSIREIDKHGVKITVFIDLPSAKNDNIYKLKSGFTIFPNGKLKCNTYIGGKQ